MFKWLFDYIASRLTQSYPARSVPLIDFERLSYEVRPCDVLLIEGRSQVSDIIRLATSSPWTHSCLYLGRLHDIESPELRDIISQHYSPKLDEQLILESMLDHGTIISPLKSYRLDHIRICRPRSLSRKDAQHVTEYAIKHLGAHYDLRQLIDLFRLLYPWGILPRRWRSSLFQYKPGPTKRLICSSIIAEAFNTVKYPILPSVRPDELQGVTLVRKNPKLITPKDFDYSPYFDIIKYPYIGIDDISLYRNLPWVEDEFSNEDDEELFCPISPGVHFKKKNTKTSLPETSTKGDDKESK